MSLVNKSSKYSYGGKVSDDGEPPSNNLWVGNLSFDVTDSDLMNLFSKYGAVDSITTYPLRCFGFVYFKRVEDAKAARDALRGTYLRGNSLKIEFARPEHWADHHDAREGQFLGRSMGPPDLPWMPLEAIRNYSEPSHSEPRRQLHSQSSGGQIGDGQPSNILCIGYPPSVPIDEQMLHNAMILFGEIERIRSFPSMHCSFVEFRSVDEARRAKEGLQGRLFNDPRISIMYSSSGLAPSSGLDLRIPRPDMLFNEPPFPTAHMGMFNQNRPMLPNTLSGPAPPSGILGPHMLMRPFAPRGSFEPQLSGPEFNDLNPFHKLPDANPNSLSGPNRRRSPPAPGMLPSSSQGVKRPIKPVPSGAWDVFDANQLQRESNILGELQRESKRSRIDAILPVYDSPFPSKKMDDHGLDLDQLYARGPKLDGGLSGPLNNVKEKNLVGPSEMRITTRGIAQGHLDHDYIWRGVIAKGGTPVCHARCVPVGKGLESEIPEVVNCSARTGLDMLTTHYADAIGFNVVFFLPDSEEDFASYTEFLRYLGEKNRAGVAKFDDGTTLFLVPPSDFLFKVLQVAGPERLYGVVLKFPQHAPTSSISMQLQSFQSQPIDGQQIPSQNEYSGMHQKDEKVLPMDYNRVLGEDTLPPTNHLPLTTVDSIPFQPAPSVNTAAVSQPKITLTPELIATLASLLPANAKSSGSETAQPSLGLSSMAPSLPPTTELDRGLLPQGWTNDHYGPEQTGHTLHQMDNQYNNPHRQQFSQLPTYPTGLSPSNNSSLGVTGHHPQVQDPAFHLPQQGAVPSRPLGNFVIPSQGGQLAASPQVDQHHHYEVPQNTQTGFGMAHGTESLGSYGSSLYQQPANYVPFPNQVLGIDVTQPHTTIPPGADKGNSEIPNQVGQFQPALYGANQGTPEVEADKNQRYQSTLQFAANLLLQIQQQQQQQTSTQAGQESANH